MLLECLQIVLAHKMEICVTRFDTLTYQQNKSWRTTNNEIGCIYGTPIKISEKILPNTLIIVVEMNNSSNTIEGIGIIKNKLLPENKKKYRIYDDNNYNRFIYKSNLRVDKSSFNNYEKKKIKKLEEMLFKSRMHCKRGQGIQSIPSFIQKYRKKYIIFLSNLYTSRFVKINPLKIRLVKNS